MSHEIGYILAGLVRRRRRRVPESDGGAGKATTHLAEQVDGGPDHHRTIDDVGCQSAAKQSSSAEDDLPEDIRALLHEKVRAMELTTFSGEPTHSPATVDEPRKESEPSFHQSAPESIQTDARSIGERTQSVRIAKPEVPLIVAHVPVEKTSDNAMAMSGTRMHARAQSEATVTFVTRGPLASPLPSSPRPKDAIEEKSEFVPSESPTQEAQVDIVTQEQRQATQDAEHQAQRVRHFLKALDGDDGPGNRTNGKRP
jgi:hypothetical protein